MLHAETLYEEEGAFIKLSYDDKLNIYMMHLDCTAWNKAEFRRYQKIFRTVLADLKTRGIKEVYGMAKDLKAIKFNRMFGATTTGDLVLDEDGKLNALIRMET
jgi:hypothetical protein